ncbi:metalloprotease [Robiginitalea aurantiaca]|uniref:Metalloprotease n=1 Tax=Robiginitalea aurantiaca TaxID=3056915 RepID=A0ABT7WFF5_9FLAO|nr:metalloprotease [Robiginitalea aurantiaca]MDM9631654.1 metalloprotease [Robiginitalea aurantiaca]
MKPDLAYPPMLRFFGTFIFILNMPWASFAQHHQNRMTATLDQETKLIEIQQEFTYVNDSEDVLRELYFNDWANSYSDKTTALAQRFSEEFIKSLHLAKESERGSTNILAVSDQDYRNIEWEHLPGRDIIRFTLNTPLPPGDSAKLLLTYTVKLPSNKFTPYGYGADGSYYLKDWYLTPAVYDSIWNLYSNKNLEDLYTDITDTNINFIFPDSLYLGTNYVDLSLTSFPGKQYANLKGVGRKSCDVILNVGGPFEKHSTPHLFVVTDIKSRRYSEILQGISIERIIRFIHENLGDFPYEQLLVSEIDFNKNPLYGLNQLPSFIRPYDEQFQFELKFLKTALSSYMRESIFLNPRKDKWISDAIINYLMINYVDTYYPEQKLLGKLSKSWLLRGTYLAQMDFNDQYSFFYMLMARRNLDQALTTSNDSLIKFNQKIANTYKAGLGLSYLDAYSGGGIIDPAIKDFFESYKLKNVVPTDFERTLKAYSKKDIDWFFRTYVTTSDQIDYKIKKAERVEESIEVTLENKTGTGVPISLFGLRNDTVVSDYWFKSFKESQTFQIPDNGEKRLVLNYDQKIPEFSQRDNWKSMGGFLSSNRRLKIQFFRDAENPYYNQVFYMPVLSFNIYDGFAPGIRLTNKTLIPRPFVFNVFPQYALREKALVGGGSLQYRHYHGKSGFYVTNYSLRGSSFHFQTNSRYSTITPAVTFGWRPDDLIPNIRSSLLMRYVNVFRTIDPSLDLETDPDYSVLNFRYSYLNNNIINFFSWFADAQHSADFTKVALNVDYRRLMINNRQINLRFFAGAFLRNDTNSDFFSFALDRPTDYLFDLNYLGRSEDSGLTSQQVIIAEGGFKSKLENPFANQWLVTGNTSFSLWRWIELYGDIGFLKNEDVPARFVYDSGIRLNLVTDYFELYFPIYSNNGWEIAGPNYDERIRFVITLSPRTLTGLFTRKWF